MKTPRDRARALLEGLFARLKFVHRDDLPLVEDLERLVVDELDDAVSSAAEAETIACAQIADGTAMRLAQISSRAHHHGRLDMAARWLAKCAGAARVHAAIEKRLPLAKRLEATQRG